MVRLYEYIDTYLNTSTRDQRKYHTQLASRVSTKSSISRPAFFRFFSEQPATVHTVETTAVDPGIKPKTNRKHRKGIYNNLVPAVVSGRSMYQYRVNTVKARHPHTKCGGINYVRTNTYRFEYSSAFLSVFLLRANFDSEFKLPAGTS